MTTSWDECDPMVGLSAAQLEEGMWKLLDHLRRSEQTAVVSQLIERIESHLAKIRGLSLAQFRALPPTMKKRRLRVVR